MPGNVGVGTSMPAYRVNVRSASHIRETLRVEKDNLIELRVEMAVFVGDLLKRHAPLIWEDQDWQIDVSDDEGLILFVIHVSAFDTAATKGSVRTL